MGKKYKKYMKGAYGKKKNRFSSWISNSKKALNKL